MKSINIEWEKIVDNGTHKKNGEFGKVFSLLLVIILYMGVPNT